jgi:hypothetical protein
VNPLIERYRNSHRHARTRGVLAGLYLVTLVLATIAAIPANVVDHFLDDRVLLTTRLYSELWLLQAGLYLWAAINVSAAITKEVERKSYDFFRLLPLSARDKVIGLVVGANLPILTFLGINFAVATLVQPMSTRSVGFHLQLHALTAASGVLFCGFSLLSSLLARGVPQSSSANVARRGVIYLFLLFGIWPLFAIMAHLSSTREDPHLSEAMPFFGLLLPASLVSLVVLGFASAWTYAASLRRLRFEMQAPFSRWGSSWFLASCCLVVLGLVLPEWVEPLRSKAFERWIGVLGTTATLLIVVMAGAREPNGGTSLLGGRSPSAFATRYFNLITAAQLAGVTALGWVASAVSLGVSAGDVFAVVLIALVTYAFITLVVEIIALLLHTFKHALLVGSFVLLVYGLFPAMVSATTLKGAYLWSGFDYLVVLLASSGERANLGQVAFGLTVNSAYCVILGLIVLRLQRRSATATTANRNAASP